MALGRGVSPTDVLCGKVSAAMALRECPLGIGAYTGLSLVYALCVCPERYGKGRLRCALGAALAPSGACHQASFVLDALAARLPCIHCSTSCASQATRHSPSGIRWGNCPLSSRRRMC